MARIGRLWGRLDVPKLPTSMGFGHDPSAGTRSRTASSLATYPLSPNLPHPPVRCRTKRTGCPTSSSSDRRKSRL